MPSPPRGVCTINFIFFFKIPVEESDDVVLSGTNYHIIGFVIFVFFCIAVLTPKLHCLGSGEGGLFFMS